MTACEIGRKIPLCREMEGAGHSPSLCLLTNEDKYGILKVEKRKQRFFRCSAQKNGMHLCAIIQRCDFWKNFSKKVLYFSKNGVYIGESLIQEVTVWNAVIQSVRIPRSSAYDGVWHTPCAQSHSQNSRRKQILLMNTKAVWRLLLHMKWLIALVLLMCMDLWGTQKMILIPVLWIILSWVKPNSFIRMFSIISITHFVLIVWR